MLTFTVMSDLQRQERGDRELAAIGAILRALDGLDGESIQRVFDYVSNRLSISVGRAATMTLKAGVPTVSVSESPSPHQRQISIRDLKEDKKPESSNQMAAIVAYYLSEVAQGAERKEAINAADLERYFKHAGFKLPKVLGQT